MARTALSAGDRRLLAAKLRTPVIVLVVLMALLGVEVLIGVWQPFARAWIVEAACAFLMVATVLVVSMELGSEPPIIRFFAVVGFFWAAILFTMTLVDYLTR